MADFPGLIIWTDAYIGDTRHLSLEESGAYLHLLMFAWRSPSCSLPDDDKRLARMLGVSPRVWQRLKPVVMDFWTLENDEWTQKKLTRERKNAEAKSEKARAAANSKWKRKQLKSNNQDDADADAIAEPEHMPERCPPSPSPSCSKSAAESGPAKAKPKPKKGTRLSSDWQPSQADLQTAYNEGLTHEQAIRTADTFRDYWIAKSGAQATKLDWSATWRNWIRRDADNRQRKGQRQGNSPHENLVGGFARSAAKHEQAARDGRDVDEIPF